MRRLSRALLAAVLGVLSATTAAAQAAAQKATQKTTPTASLASGVQAPGSRILVDIPKTFKSAERFVGFYDEGRRISILLADMPSQAYVQMVAGFTTEALATRGMAPVAHGPLARSDEHLYRRAQQTAAGERYDKFLLVFKTEDATLLATINVPNALLARGTVKVAEFEAILSSARAAAQTKVMQPVATIDDPAPLKLAMTFGQTRMWTMEGRKGQTEASSPSLILAASINFDVVPDAMRLAATALPTLAGFTDIVLDEPTLIRFGGQDAVELLASARQSTTGLPQRLYQVVVAPKSGGYVRIIGISPADQIAQWLPVFKAAAQSLRLNK